MAKRLGKGRREELLDGVMQIIIERGFSEVRISEIAAELHCSAASLYKIAPSKDSLVLLAIGRWAEFTLPDLEARSRQAKTAADRARGYFRAGAQSIHSFSVEFFTDVERFESTRVAWQALVVDPYLERFVELVDVAKAEGDIRNMRYAAEPHARPNLGDHPRQRDAEGGRADQ